MTIVKDIKNIKTKKLRRSLQEKLEAELTMIRRSVTAQFKGIDTTVLIRQMRNSRYGRT